MKTVVGFFGLLGIIGAGTALLHAPQRRAGCPISASRRSCAETCRGRSAPPARSSRKNMVDVGAQVTGKIASFGPDPRGKTDPRFKGKTVDFSSPVEQGDPVGADRRRLVQGPVRPGHGDPGARQGPPRRR